MTQQALVCEAPLLSALIRGARECGNGEELRFAGQRLQRSPHLEPRLPSGLATPLETYVSFIGSQRILSTGIAISAGALDTIGLRRKSALPRRFVTPNSGQFRGEFAT